MISTNYEKFYIKGEKSGANTITLSSHYLINVEIEEKTSNLNGNVSYDVVGNGTKNVDITFTYSDLYINGETYNATVTASDGIDTLIIPVIINCSDTLIYTDVSDVIDVYERIHINCESLPEVKRATIVNKNGESYTFPTSGNDVNLMYSDILSKINNPYEYILLDNGLSQISYKLEEGTYEFYSLDDTYITMRDEYGLLKIKIKSTVNNINIQPTVDFESKSSISYMGDGIYEILCNIGANTEGVEREFYITVTQPKTGLSIIFHVIQNGYVSVPEGHEMLFAGEYTRIYAPNAQYYESRFLGADHNVSKSGLVLAGARGYDEKPEIYDDYYWEQGSSSAYTDEIYGADVTQLYLKKDLFPAHFGEKSILKGYVSSFDGNYYFVPSNLYKFLYLNPKARNPSSSYRGLFAGCNNLVDVTLLDTSNVTDMRYMFYKCGSLTSIPLLDTSKVTDMVGTFEGCTSLTSIPLSDTSKVTDMYSTFNGCTSLTSIPQLDTSNVTNMGSTFEGCSSLTSIPQLDTSKVTDMYSTFNGCTSLTSIPLSDTSKVTQMSDAFNGCSSLTSIPQLDTSRVLEMGSTFEGCSSLTSIPQLDTSRVHYMDSTFNGCSSLTSIPQLDTSNVTDMGWMFYNCSSLTTIPLLDTSNVTDMDYMFYGCSKLTTIPQLDTSRVYYMNNIFEGCSSLTSIPQLDTSGVHHMHDMFYKCSSLTEIPQLDTSNVTNMFRAFYYCASLTDLGGFVGLRTGLNLSYSPLLTHESLMNVINNLSFISGVYTLSLGEVNLAKLTDDEIKIATDKGWTVN